MCVIAFAWNVHPRWRLVLAGNRDELHARPTAPLARWRQPAGLCAGRDLEAGGTWMGVADTGRAAVVTSVRDPAAAHDGTSRGLLVTDYLAGTGGALAQARALHPRAAGYRPFNLLLFDADDACFVSNHPASRLHAVEAGVHGLSNGDLDAPWPKVRRMVAALDGWLHGGGDFEPLLAALADTRAAPDADLPDTGVGLELERRLSPVFVRGDRYGTRAGTVIAMDRAGGGCIIERRFDAGGIAAGTTRLAFGRA